MMWKDPNCVYTHKNKLFLKHVNEIVELGKHFLEFHRIPLEFYEYLSYLANYHDIGKTYYKWDFGKKIPHSRYSLRYILEKKEFFKNNPKLTWLLLFFIAKHHSALTSGLADPDSGMAIDQLNSILKKKAFEWAFLINITDTFGFFKLADVCSANNRIDFKFKKPKADENIVRAIIGNNIDETKFAQQKSALLSAPNITILRAYTGWGKTDVSTLFFEQKNVSRIFYMFPTITAINKFEEKLKRAVGDEVSKYFHLYLADVREDEDKIRDLFYVRSFSSPYIITTVDQFLLAFLQVGKYFLKRPMFRDSGIVVDEVHLLTPLMLHLLVYFVKKFQEIYNFRILFMSATLPQALNSYLTSELGLRSNSVLDFSSEYEKKRRVMWEQRSEKIENVLADLADEKKLENKKILLVVNTVKKAVQLAHMLQNEYKKEYEKEFNIIHARLAYDHRKEKEKWINSMKDLPHILVSTQVCEVSLDINYDLLITERASIPALIQRFGRINRRGNEIKEVNVCVAEPEVSERYPYTPGELREADKMIQELERENLKNEKNLLEYLDQQLSEDKLRREIEKEIKDIDIKAWEETFCYFFSMRISDEKMRGLINYRDGLTTNIIPHPKCISDEKFKNYVKTFLERARKVGNLTYEEKMKIIGNLLGISVPVPFWWLKNIKPEEIYGFPVVDLSKEGIIYDDRYGFERL
ncbi:MAG: CRISPR-associated helicase Cas3' [Archaeoglobi archaeon]|nr:MAG: CRISPR-associated helicase Cas3' [Archaeoglobi archaeon]TDA26404.1 MAG: CRISPR-associated helicase Cas3' [Archaeoglobi archaeon]